MLWNRLSLSLGLAVPFCLQLAIFNSSFATISWNANIRCTIYKRNIVVSPWLEKPSFTASFPLNTKGLSLKSLFLGDDSLIEKKLQFDSEVLVHKTTVILILHQK